VSVAGVLGGRRQLARRIAGVHYCSSYVRDLVGFELFGAGPRPVERVVPSFRIDPVDEPSRAVLASLPSSYILFVGALRLVKGLLPLLSAYASLSDAPPLVLMGPRTPDTPGEFPPGVRIIESVPHATVMEAWDRALFGVAPSTLAEPFGNVVHEAMSRGRAVIGTAPSGMSDIIEDGVSGLLVPRDDAHALGEAMRRLIEDPPFRKRLEAAAVANAGRFTVPKVIPQFEELYESVLASPKALPYA